MDRIKKTFRYLAILNVRRFWIGFIIGYLYFSYVFFWLWGLYPLDSFGVPDRFPSFLLILLIFSVSAAGMAFFWGLFSMFASRILQSEHTPQLVPAEIAGSFVLVEYLRSFFFGILWLGNGSFIGPHWTIGNPAYLLKDFGYILKTSSLWGIYGIDFLLLYLVGVILLFLKRKESKKTLVLLWVPILFLSVHVFLFGRDNRYPEEGTLSVALIQTQNSTKFSYTPEENLNNLQQRLSLLKQASESIESDKGLEDGIVILPEGSHFLNSLAILLSESSVKNYFDKLSKKELFIIDQILSADGGGDLRSKVVIINSKTGLTGTYDKRLLTPGGEFTPYILKIPLILSGYGKFLPPDLYPGSARGIAEFSNQKVKIVVCSEILSPSIVSGDNGNFIVALSNFGLFHGNRFLENQMLAISKFRAAENRKYIVISSNSGQSYIINPAGKVEKKTLGVGYELLTGSIVPNRDRTWYNYVGDWPILSLSLIFFGLALRKIRNDTKS